MIVAVKSITGRLQSHSCISDVYSSTHPPGEGDVSFSLVWSQSLQCLTSSSFPGISGKLGPK